MLRRSRALSGDKARLLRELDELCAEGTLRLLTLPMGTHDQAVCHAAEYREHLAALEVAARRSGKELEAEVLWRFRGWTDSHPTAIRLDDCEMDFMTGPRPTIPGSRPAAGGRGAPPGEPRAGCLPAALPAALTAALERALAEQQRQHQSRAPKRPRPADPPQASSRAGAGQAGAAKAGVSTARLAGAAAAGSAEGPSPRSLRQHRPAQETLALAKAARAQAAGARMTGPPTALRAEAAAFMADAAPTPPEPLRADVVRVLTGHGLVQRPAAGADSASRYLSVPGAAELCKALRRGRAELVRRVRATRYGEAPRRELERKGAAWSPLPADAHVADAVGSGWLCVAETASGQFLRVGPAAPPPAAATAGAAAGGRA